MFTPLLSDHLWVFFPRWMICPCRFGEKNAITDGANLTGRGENTMRIHANKSGPQGWLCNRHRSELEIQNHCISDPWVWSYGPWVSSSNPSRPLVLWMILTIWRQNRTSQKILSHHIHSVSSNSNSHIMSIEILKWVPWCPEIYGCSSPKIWFFHSFWMLLTHPQQFSQRDKVWVPTSSSCWSFRCLAAWKFLRGKSPRTRYEWREK